MNRLEEAFNRAQRGLRLPDSFAAPDASALEKFSSTGPRTEVDDDVPAAAVAVPVRVSVPDRGSAGAILSPASLPIDGAPPAAPNGHNGVSLATMQSRLVTSEEVSASTLEQYRRLAATLHQAQLTDGIKVVMVASALGGEGKTLTTVNLALTLSRSYERRVLLIDADLRRPMLHHIFGFQPGSGLHEGLKADDERKLTVLEMSPRLSLLPAGKPEPDPMSALTSERMRLVIKEAAAKFEWVIIDTPPVGILADAHLLAAMVDVAVLVVQAGRTPYTLIQRAIDSIGRNRVIGVVLNFVANRSMMPGGKYDQYYDYAYSPRSVESEKGRA
jgi:protein-tyrosine kinase